MSHVLVLVCIKRQQFHGMHCANIKQRQDNKSLGITKVRLNMCVVSILYIVDPKLRKSTLFYIFSKKRSYQSILFKSTVSKQTRYNANSRLELWFDVIVEMLVHKRLAPNYANIGQLLVVVNTILTSPVVLYIYLVVSGRFELLWTSLIHSTRNKIIWSLFML